MRWHGDKNVFDKVVLIIEMDVFLQLNVIWAYKMSNCKLEMIRAVI